ncbi:hypothetical protein [Methylobacterium sp. Leaf117]|uniref:hypothetical protein n=1 Tax=Methylobacterium sp. Leaf117 TaxID=1736260 RepID=UPI0006FEFCAC|nr:hypothetical protein [Methylobacterium sp. Leaf117]KQP91885.1 hypothetical protein ASF57_05175 [Methylobacterium sp. Leaf117]
MPPRTFRVIIPWRGSLPWRAILPWLALAAGLVLATLPVWRPLVFGRDLSLDDLLTLRCLGV